ncbi:MAG: carboxypeptidase-like regulatory domain-containing protein [Spirosomataceae bacterium]
MIDADNQQALVGGTVALVGHSTSVMTDSNGNFILRNIPRNSQLIIKSIGYQPTQLTVKDSILPIIAMQEDKQVLSEVVVSSHPDKNQKVSPKNGWKAYNEYLITSAARFVAQHPQAPRGRVVVGFTIDKTGKLKDFKNQNKAEPLLFEEAVRIVKEGDMWNVTYKKKKPQTKKAEFIIDFK